VSIEAGIYTRLTGSTDITAMVGTRVYPSHVPQGTSFPMLRYTIITQEQIHGLSAHTDLYRATFQVDCYTSNTYLDVIALADKVRATLNTESTTFGTIAIEQSHVRGMSDEPPFKPSDSSDEWIFGRSVDCDLHYHST